MKFVVDGVVFQSAERGIGDVWQAVLPLLVDRHQFGIVLLDRGGAPAIPGVVLWPFPSYDWTSTAADSALLETTCRLHCADLFASTSSTTPLRTPSLCLVHDMIPEPVDAEVRPAREKELSIAHARRHLCSSHKARHDLLELHPELDPGTVEVISMGPDPAIFAESLATCARLVVDAAKTGAYDDFYDRWSSLRTLQAHVDVS